MPTRKLALFTLATVLVTSCGQPLGIHSTPETISPSATASPSGPSDERDEGEKLDEGGDGTGSGKQSDTTNDDPVEPSASPGAPRDIVTTTISGVVTTDEQSPVQGICIDMIVDDEGTWWDVRKAVDRTDASGRYEVSFSQDRDQALIGARIRFRDCRASPRLAFEWFDDVTDQSDAKILDHGGKHTANARLSPAATLSGSVENEAGVGIAGICVYLYDGTWHDDVDERESYVPYATTTTSGSGSYSFAGLAGKTYRIRFSSGSRYSDDCGGGAYRAEWYDDHAIDGKYYSWPNWPPSDTVTLSVGEDRTGIDAVLAPSTDGS